LASRYTTVDSFEHWNPNIQSLADRLLIGPQRELLQKVQDFNNRYGMNLNVTRTYRWSPGYMNQIKDFMVDRYLQNHMKRKISTYYNQIDNKTWMINSFSRILKQIEETLAEKRRTRAIFQDNSDIIEDRWEILHRIIVRETEKVQDTINHVEFQSEILESDNQKYQLSFTWAFPEMDMNIFVGQEYFPVEMGKVEVNIVFDLDDLVTQLCNDGCVQFVTIGPDENCGIIFNNLSRGSNYGKIAAYYAPKHIGGNTRLLHPFVSAYQHDTRVIDGNGFTSTCLGDLTGRIWSELSEMDLLSTTLTLQQWLTTFNARDTRPLNNIRTTFWGLPERLNHQSFLNVYPMNPESCGYISPEIEHYEEREDAIVDGFDNTYCDTVNCGLREACSYYKFIEGTLGASAEPATEEPSIEERFPQTAEALRETAIVNEDFEVVDRDADNIHGGEYAQTHTVDRDDVRRDPQGNIIGQFDPEAIVEEVNAINRENGLNDDGTPRDYNEEMDRINGDNPITEEQVLEQLIRQQYQVIDIGRE